MKKFLSLGVFVVLFFGVSHAALVDDAVSWAYTNNLTIHKTSKDFKVDQNIRRDEAAKFFVNFSKLVGKNVYVKTDSECKFSDIDQSWSDLKNVVVESCKLGIFQGSNGKFNPRGFLTQGQAVAVLIRIVDGYQSEYLSNWSEKYYKKADELKLLTNVDVYNRDSLSTRGTVMKLLYNARKMKLVDNTNIATQIDQSLSWMKDDVSSDKSSVCQDIVFLNSFLKGNNYKYFNIVRMFEGPWLTDITVIVNPKKDISHVINSMNTEMSKISYLPNYSKNIKNILSKYKLSVSLNSSDYKSEIEKNILDNRIETVIDSKCNVIGDGSAFKEFYSLSRKIGGDYVPDDMDDINENFTISKKYKAGKLTIQEDLGGFEYPVNLRYEFDDKIGYHHITVPFLMYVSSSITDIYNSNDSNQFGIPVEDIKYITSNIDYYGGRLIGLIKKSDGTFPRLKKFEVTKDGVDFPAIRKYIKDLWLGKVTSNYFTKELGYFESEIDKLYE